MRTELEKFHENQVYLKEDGSYIWLTSVDPVNRIKSTEKDRTAFYHIGRVKKKKDEFDDSLVIIENAPTNSVISFDISKSYSINLAALRSMCPIYIGTITDNKIKDIQRKK